MSDDYDGYEALGETRADHKLSEEWWEQRHARWAADDAEEERAAEEDES